MIAKLALTLTALTAGAAVPTGLGVLTSQNTQTIVGPRGIYTSYDLQYASGCHRSGWYVYLPASHTLQVLGTDDTGCPSLHSHRRPSS